MRVDASVLLMRVDTCRRLYTKNATAICVYIHAHRHALRLTHQHAFDTFAIRCVTADVANIFHIQSTRYACFLSGRHREREERYRERTRECVCVHCDADLKLASTMNVNTNTQTLTLTLTLTLTGTVVGVGVCMCECECE